MRKRKKCFKWLAVKLILILLISNFGFSPKVYAANLGSISYNPPASKPSPKVDGGTPISSLTNQVNGIGASPKPNLQSNILTGNVYAEQVDKEIDYPIFLNPSLSLNKKASQPNGVFMKHVIHMPKLDEKPVPFTPRTDMVLNGQNPTLNQNNNNPGIAGSMNGSVPTSPNALVISELKEVDENDLNLINVESTVNQDQGGSGVTGLVYNSTSGKVLPSQANLNRDSVAPSVYSVGGEVNGSFPIRNKAGYFSVGFSHRTDINLFRFSHKNANLTLSPLNPASVSGNVYKNSITYQEIYPNTDLRYMVEKSRLKEEIVVKKYTGKSDFFFQMSVENAVYKVMPDSTILFYDPASNQPLFYIPRGYAVDSNGNRCDSVSYEFTQEGLLRVSIDPNWLQQAAYPVVIDPTINLFDATFLRPSVAYKQDGTQVASGSPRYEAAKFNQGIMIEEGTTNLLSANQSSVETDLTGWTGYGGILTRDTTEHWTGSASLKFATTAVGDYFIESSPINVSPSTQYTYSAYVKIPTTLTNGYAWLRVIEYNAAGGYVTEHIVAPKNLAPTWERQKDTFTTNANTAKVQLRLHSSGIGTIYWDGIQLEQKPYPTSFTEVTRSSDTLTIPTAGVLNPQEGSIEILSYIDPTTVHSANNPNWSMVFSVVNIGSPYSEMNQISIRRSPSTTTWGVWFTNPSAAASAVNLGNITTPGWYRFGVTWKQGVGGYGYLNGVLKGSVAATYLPSQFNSYAQIGAWLSGGGLTVNSLVDDLRISSVARNDQEMANSYNSNQPLPVDVFTTCKLSFDGSIHAYPTINLVNPNFSRPSVAYKQDGTQVASGSPRYETGKFNQGLMLEESTTNLLTANQSSVETDLTGWAPNVGILTRDTTEHWAGSASLKFVTTTVGDYFIESSPVNVSPSTQYTYSAYVKIPTALTNGYAWLRVIEYNATGGYVTEHIASPKNLAPTWERQTDTFTTNANTAIVRLRLHSSGIGTIYWDGIQLEQKPYATSFTEVTRSSDSLTIPTAGVLNPQEGSIEMLSYIDPTTVHSANNPNWSMVFSVVNIGSPYSEMNQISIRRNPSTTNWGVWFTNPSAAASAVNLGNIITPGWYRFGVTWKQGVGGYGYLNGVLKGSVTATYLPSQFNSYAQIGAWLPGGLTVNSLVDDLRISSVARNDQEMANSYNSNQPLPVDQYTTAKLNFDGSITGYTTVQSGAGIEPYWNYTSMGLGGGWQASVNTWNLNLILSKPLFLIPGRGMPIGESITYNSILGKTWTFGNNTSLVENQDGSVVYNKSDGGSYTFTPNGSGGYTAPPGVYLTLQKNGTGNFTILDKHKNTYNYVNGKPNQFTDRNNNTTTFTYDGSGRLYQVSDPSGRKLTYAYDAGGHVGSITDPANHAYQFTYQNDYLMSVKDPANNTFTLSYDANGRVATFTDPLNRVTSFYGNPNGQIMRLRDARTNGQDVYETSFTQALEGSSIITMITDPGNKISTFYNDNNTGNLTKYQDALGNTWQYVWTNNNLTQTQDAKGQTTNQYDSWGNVTSQTTTVDAYPGNNIVKTMTYDEYNQLLTVVDGSGRTTSYKYNNRGNLLSTSDPNTKESNGRRYDQYGNTVEYSPGVLGNHNLLRNGSMEIAGTGGNLLANWYREPGVAAVSLEGFNSHGNSALKISSSTSTTALFYQQTGIVYIGDKLTLRADVKLDNVQPSAPNGGAEIKLEYLGGWSESWYVWGTGTVPIMLTSSAAENIVTVYIGLKNASGTAWFDGVQLENAGGSSQGYVLSGFNSVENSGFEQNLEYWGYTGTTPTVTNEAVWGGTSSLKVNLPTPAIATVYQDVPVYGGEALTFSGMVKTNGISGNGAYYKIDYYDTLNNLIPGATVQTGYVTGTQDWTRLSTLATAPANANRAKVQGILDGSGTAYFDAIKLIPRNSQKYTYDTAGNYVTISEDPLSKQNKHTYDQNTGNKLTFTDALNYTTSYSYDNLNRLVQITDPLNRSSYYEYDSVSNRINTRDPRSASAIDNTYRTFYGPNNLNNLANLTDPLNQNVSYTYDRSGNLIEVSLDNGLKENFSYDSANRLIKTALDGGKYFTYTYDGANELTGVIDQDNNSYSWNYDGAHRLTSSTDTFGFGLNYQWDKSNNLVSMSGSDYGSNQYFYGSDNRLLSVTLPNGSNIFYDYDENGRIFNVRYPGSNYRKINYAPNGWLSKIQDPSFPGKYHYEYTHYNNGTISGYSSWAGWDSFGYDADGRLTYWYYSPMGGGSSIQENYSYDAAGNLLTKGSKTFIYNSANQITNPGFIYDANGNMTGDGNFIYVYNALNQLVQVKKASDSSLVASYTYNHNGLRKSKTVNGQTTNYNWDATGHLIKESNSGGNTYYYYDTSGDLVGLKKNNITYIVHDNHRGDIVSITDPSNNIVAQYHFDPWGNQISYSGTLSQPIRYAGYYYDEETGLYYLKNRYYSPALGRFLTRDSIDYTKYSDPQTLNLYSYAGNNPVSLIDTNGNWASEAEREYAKEHWSEADYNKLDELSSRWWKEPGNRSAIEKEANGIRFEYDDQYDDLYDRNARERGSSSDKKKREKRQIDDAWGKDRAAREGKSRELHDSKKGGRNDDNQSYNDLKNGNFVDKMGTITGLSGGALAVYLIISEGSRLFPPRNLIPVP